MSCADKLWLHFIEEWCIIPRAKSGCGPVGRAPGLGPGCREFESPHSDMKKLRFGGVFSYPWGRLEQSNATRKSVAAAGWTAAHHSVTSLATQTRKTSLRRSFFIPVRETRTIKCNAAERCCRRLDGGAPQCNESRHSDQNRQFSLRKLAVLTFLKDFSLFIAAYF